VTSTVKESRVYGVGRSNALLAALISVLVWPARPEITSGGERGKIALTTFGLIYDDHRDLGRSLTQLLESGKIKAGVVYFVSWGRLTGHPNRPAV
jgi:hypothetical protein